MDRKDLSNLLYTPLNVKNLDIPDLTGTNNVIIGATNLSGFGYSLAGAIGRAGGNIVITGSTEKSTNKLKNRHENAIKKYPNLAFNPIILPCDISNSRTITSLRNTLLDKIGWKNIDNIIIAAVGGLDSKYFLNDTPWKDIPKESQRKCLNVTALGPREIYKLFRKNSTVDKPLRIFATSFSLTNFPNYPLGYAKEKLEKNIHYLSLDSPYNIIPNTLILGPFKSVAALGIPTHKYIYEFAKKYPKDFTIPTMNQMVESTINLFNTKNRGTKFRIDGGLRKFYLNNKKLFDLEFKKIINNCNKEIKEESQIIKKSKIKNPYK